MTLKNRCRILRGDALFLGLASTGAARNIPGSTPHAAIGLVEAYRLALILAVL